MVSLWDLPGHFWNIARKIDELSQLQTSMRAGLKSVEDRMRALEDRMTHLEANQGHLVVEAKAAAVGGGHRPCRIGRR